MAEFGQSVEFDFYRSIHLSVDGDHVGHVGEEVGGGGGGFTPGGRNALTGARRLFVRLTFRIISDTDRYYYWKAALFLSFYLWNRCLKKPVKKLLDERVEASAAGIPDIPAFGTLFFAICSGCCLWTDESSDRRLWFLCWQNKKSARVNSRSEVNNI